MTIRHERRRSRALAVAIGGITFFIVLVSQVPRGVMAHAAQAPAGTRTVLDGVDIGSPLGHGLRCIDITARAANEQWYPDHGVLNATKDQLKAMPQFKYSTYN